MYGYDYAETFNDRMDRARDALDPERFAYMPRYTVLPRCRVFLALSTGEVAALCTARARVFRHRRRRCRRAVQHQANPIAFRFWGVERISATVAFTPR